MRFALTVLRFLRDLRGPRLFSALKIQQQTTPHEPIPANRK
jgi:hypothetical protein